MTQGCRLDSLITLQPLKGRGGGSLRAELVPVPAVSHPWHPHPTVKQLLLLTHFTDEKGEVQRGKGPACGCGRQVV